MSKSPPRCSARAQAGLAAAIIVFLSTANLAPAAERSRARQVEIRYVAAKSETLEPVYRYVKESRALERVRDLLSALRLPRRLLINTESCDGVSNAWYEGDQVTICYEFLDDIWKNASNGTPPAGLAPVDTVVGPFADVVLHEVGHAVFDTLSIPVLGREEDAADQFSAYIMLHRYLILSAACSVN